MKGPSERLFREALNELDMVPTFAYKPPDDARNWKPCDYMLWFPGGTAWFEVKETPNIGVWPIADLRASQREGIATARRLGIPYLLAIRWRRTGMWSLVDAIRLLDALNSPVIAAQHWTNVTRVLLESRFGVSCAPGQLPSMIRAALTEGL